MNGPVLPQVSGELPPRSPLSLSAVRDLFFRPTRYFRSADLRQGGAWLFAAWMFGIASSIGRIDQNLLRADVAQSRAGWETLGPYLTESWVRFWVFVLIVGAIGATLIWYIGGWWYNVRLRWSGATDFDKREGRLVYVFTSLVEAIPSLIYALTATALFPNYLAAWKSEDTWATVLLVFPFWAALVSYKGVRAKFRTRAIPTRIWFLILPMLLYAGIFGTIAALSRSPAGDLEAIAALRASDPTNTVTRLETYLTSRPRDDLAWTILGHTYHDLDNEVEAEAAYEKALAINPRRVEALTAMGVLRSQERKYDEALGFYERSLAIDPTYAQAHSSIAVIALKQSDDARALEHMKRAYSLDSTDAVIAANLALAYHYNGALEMRDRMTERASRLGYSNIQALYEIYRGERTVRDRQ